MRVILVSNDSTERGWTQLNVSSGRLVQRSSQLWQTAPAHAASSGDLRRVRISWSRSSGSLLILPSAVLGLAEMATSLLRRR